MERAERMGVRDLISLGVFNAIGIVCYAVLVALACSTVAGLFLSTAIAFLGLGTIYMLIVTKVRKKGTFFICAIIMSVIGIIGGRIYTTLGCILAGVVSEIIAGNYKNWKRIVLAYCGYAGCFALGIYLPGVMFGAEYLMKQGRNKGMAAEVIERYAQFFSPGFLVGLVVLNMAAAFVGTVIARKILKKHFEKTGLLEETKTYHIFSYRKGHILKILSGIRKMLQNPKKILTPYIKEGMTAADVGCGMGYFTVPMLEMVGKKGKVVAFDLQQQMLTATLNSAKRKKLESKLYLNQCRENSLVIDCWENKLDFALLFAMAHEAGNRDNLFRELSWAMKPGAKLLMAEPARHVSRECFDESVEIAQKYGLVIVERPKIKCSQAVVFQKK